MRFVIWDFIDFSWRIDKVDILKTNKLELPEMRMVRQLFSVPPRVDVSAEIENEWERVKASLRFPDRKDIAVGVGSRGIANLTGVVRAVVAKIKAAGFDPFINTLPCQYYS